MFDLSFSYDLLSATLFSDALYSGSIVAASPLMVFRPFYCDYGLVLIDRVFVRPFRFEIVLYVSLCANVHVKSLFIRHLCVLDVVHG